MLLIVATVVSVAYLSNIRKHKHFKKLGIMSKLEAIERKYKELTNQIHNLIEEENRLIGGCIQNGTPDAWKDESLEVGKNVALTNKAIKKIEAEIALIEPDYIKLLENS